MEKSVYNISHDTCTGCMMCGDLCSKDAIKFEITDGFWFPVVDEQKCINCGLCTRKCPALHDAPEATGPIACYGAKSKNEDIRWNSTSGGFFSELAYHVIGQNGYCIGAVYGKNNEIVHQVESTKDGIERLRQSKYAQSRTEGIYALAKRLLADNKLVLFCGTACQVEALKSYLGKPYKNLITMDFICLGICSPVVYRKYLDYYEKKYKSKVSKVWFKNKKNGWRSISTQLEFENGAVYNRVGSRDLFMVAFVGDSIAMRKNCDSCKFRKIPHNSDFTVADFWGVERINPVIDDNKGLSAVFVNTQRANNIFEAIKDSLDHFESNVDDITRGNFSALKPKTPGANRDAFLSSLENLDLRQALSKYGTAYSGINRIKIEMRHYKDLLYSIITNKTYGKN